MRTATRLLLFLALAKTIAAYSKYAEPIEVAQPNANGVYEFHLMVEKKLTMSYGEPPFGHRTLVDYDVDQQTWYARDPDQLVACDKRDKMDLTNNKTDAFIEDILTLDGLHFRVISINGKSPGPLLVVPFGAEVLVKVSNMLMLDSFSIHFHGIDKQGLWYEDGVSFVQQCPIATMTNYQYRFFADRAGTHWYHGHLQSDRGDGLAGGFVVRELDTTVPTMDGGRVQPSREYFTLLQDWSNDDAGDTWLALKEKTMKWMYGMDQMEKCWEPTRVHDGGNVGGAIPFSAILFNDKGWHDQTDIRTRPDKLPLETYRIKQGESILMRIVNGGLAQELMISIEGHNLTIVAADGNEVIPMTVNNLIIFPGERYDILIKGHDKPEKKNFYVIAETVQYYFFDWSHVETTYGIANLEYEDVEDNGEPNLPRLGHPTCSQGQPCTCIAVDTLESPFELQDPEILAEKKFDQGYEEHFINMHYDSHVNGYKFEFSRGMPYYYGDTFMDTVAKDCSKIDCPRNHSKYDENCRCFYHLKHKLDNIVQLTIYNMGLGGGHGSGYAHPLHIHSTHTYLVKMGWPSYNGTGMISDMNQDLPCPSADAICDDLRWTDQAQWGGALKGMRKRPSLRDTILIPVGGYATIRFRASNPGWWVAHCHLELHMMGGAAYAFKIGEDHEIPAPPADFPHDCGNFERKSLPDDAKQRMDKRMDEEKHKKRRGQSTTQRPRRAITATPPRHLE
ncbi:unnamed protein product, partial [Mesorhabditis spiculigera]